MESIRHGHTLVQLLFGPAKPLPPIPAPKPAKGSFNEEAAERGRTLFCGKGEVRHLPRSAAVYRAGKQPARAI